MIKRLLKILPSAVGLLAALTASGCGSSARYIEPGGPEALVTVSAVDPAEWKRVAGEAAQSLVSSGALKRTDGAPSVVMIGRVRNYTLIHLEMGLLTNQLRQAILTSGQARVTSAVGYSGNLDRAVRRVRNNENDDLFNQATVLKRGTVVAPNFSLAGAVIQQNTISGRTEESYYMFHLTLTDLKTGVAVWEKTVDFAKQATRPLL
ncbi:MAG: penicillin-binding protein activator LpoB [Lentisphaeria bacterium]|nr:penicillin-binding protein activator LpoB [Lentisphaeria bacterium]